MVNNLWFLLFWGQDFYVFVFIRYRSMMCVIFVVYYLVYILGFHQICQSVSCLEDQIINSYPYLNEEQKCSFFLNYYLFIFNLKESCPLHERLAQKEND